MLSLFTRSKLNPIIESNPANAWEEKKVYNPGVIFFDNKYHLFYRAVGGNKIWKSAIGYAVSEDGENFQRFKQPILSGETKAEKRGLEDPRLTKIGDTFYMAYAAFDGLTPRLNIATSRDLKNWEKQGPALSHWRFRKAGGVFTEFDDTGRPFFQPMKHEWSKSGAIFPEKINGNFLMLFGEHRLWLATSKDGLKWQGGNKPFLMPRKGKYFDNAFVEMGPPPLKTAKGWLVLYHGIDKQHWYKIGMMLLDLHDPEKILYRSKEPIFWPETGYELSGLVDVLPGGLEAIEKMSELDLKYFLMRAERKHIMPKVVFCCGATLVNKVLRIFYGAGDSVIGTATANIDDILNLIK